MKSLNPNNFGKKLLVESCAKIKIKDLLKRCKINFKEILLRSEIEAMGENIELTTSTTSHGGVRFWFKCPLCDRRTSVLYRHPLNSKVGCRDCLNLDYRKRRFKGMIENS